MGGGPETTGSSLHCSNYVPFGFLSGLLSAKKNPSKG